MAVAFRSCEERECRRLVLMLARQGYYSAAIMTEITDEQLEDIKQSFGLYDGVGDDKIDSADVIKLLQALALNPLTADVKKVLEDSQLDKTRVDFPTFVSIYEQFQKRPTIANHADLMEQFQKRPTIANHT